MRSVFCIGLLTLTMLAGISGPVLAEQAQGFPVIGPLKEEHNDVGCRLVFRNGRQYELDFFSSFGDDAWMNIDGQDRKLTPVSPDYFENPEYRVDDIAIKIDFGKVRQMEGVAIADKARVTIIKNGQKQVIKARGGCGC